MLPCKSWYWDMHGLIFETSIWLLAGSISEACSISNQRPPNSFHHENALPSNLFINGTHKLRTQPHGNAWHSRHERPTTHIPAKEEPPRKKVATFQLSKAGYAKTPKSETAEKKTANLHRSSRTRVHAQSYQHNDGYWHRRCILKPPCTEETRPIQVRALTTHTHGTFGMTTCTRCRQLNTWIDFEMVNFDMVGKNFSGRASAENRCWYFCFLN